jgi:hypothetical protein
MSPLSPHATNSRSVKRTANDAGFPSPSQLIQPPDQPAVDDAEALAAVTAARKFVAANPDDAASHIIALLCNLLAKQLNAARTVPASSPSSELSANELERQRSIVISGIPEALSNSISTARDAYEKNAVFALIDRCKPPPAAQPSDPQQPPPRQQPPPEVCVVAAYRMGQPSRDRPRLLKVVFATRSMQRSVLSAARHLRSDQQYQDVYVRPSLTKQQRDDEYKLRVECRKLREQGKQCSIRNGEIVMGN